MQKLAIFDLDNTLIAGDSDETWGQFLVELGVRDAETFGEANKAFYQDYLAGTLDIIAFQEFQLKILTEYPLDTVLAWQTQFMVEKIKPLYLDEATRVIQQHKTAGDELLIITATNNFITRPIATALGINALIATEAEMIDGAYTGKISGIPSYAQGKVTRLNQWLAKKETTLEQLETWFYSDSHNDIPLLEKVTHAYAVDADDKLKAHAHKQDWNICSFR
jgi:HAD superfamily hydrolase (TIGR01490 family)